MAEPRVSHWNGGVVDGDTEKNRAIIAQRHKDRMTKTDPLVGDYIVMPDGQYHRLAYAWMADAGFQTCKGGSFYCWQGGNATMSGSLDKTQPSDRIVPTPELKEAMFWIFHEDWTGAHRGVYFLMEVRVWRLLSDEEYADMIEDFEAIERTAREG